MSELKKCPFCGGNAEIIKTRACGRYVLCLDCDALTAEYDTDDAGSAYNKAVAAWNRRADHIRDTTKKVSNADKIRSTNDEELAGIIAAEPMAEKIPFCKDNPKCDAMLDEGLEIPESMCAACVLDWLRQPAETEGTE